MDSKPFEENENIDMIRFKVIIDNNFIKLGRDCFGRLYRIVGSNMNIHKGDDEYFCFIKRKKCLFWMDVEVIYYEDYLRRLNKFS